MKVVELQGCRSQGCRALHFFGGAGDYRRGEGSGVGRSALVSARDTSLILSRSSEAAVAAKAEAVLVNSILPGIGNSAGLAKKGERCPERETAMLKRAQAEVAGCGCRSNASTGASRRRAANDKAVSAALTFG